MSGFLSKASLTILLSSILFTGCGGDAAPPTGGGGGGGGIIAAPASIDASNTEAIGKAAGEAIQVAEASNILPTGITTTNNTSADLTRLNDIFVDAATSAVNASSLPTGIDVSASVCDSGTATLTTTGTTAAVDATMIFSSCVLIGSGGVTATGTFVIHFDNISDTSGTAGFSFSYINFTIIDIDGTIINLNMTMDCPTGITSCTFSADFTGTDGITHRVSTFSFTGNAATGFDGTATVTHGTHGSVSITATAITYGTCGSYPDGGTIAFSSSDGSSGTIIFNADCSVSGTWSNAGGSGSF